MHIQNSRWQLKPLELGCSMMHLFQVGQGSAILFFQCIEGRLYLHPIVTGQDLQALTSWIPVFSSAQSLHKILLMKQSITAPKGPAFCHCYTLSESLREAIRKRVYEYYIFRHQLVQREQRVNEERNGSSLNWISQGHRPSSRWGRSCSSE